MPTARRFPLFDSFRAFAACAVLLDHWTGQTGLAPPSTSFPAHLGDYGVVVFFLISGFLLYRPFLTGAVETRRFYGRRALRIVPGYWLALTVLMLIPTAGVTVHGQDWWQYYFFGQAYTACPICSGLQQAWTLCAEVVFYLLLPGFAFLAARLRLRLHVLLIAAIGATVLLKFQTHPFPVERTIIGDIDWFMWGMVIAVASTRWTRGPRWLPAVSWIAAAGLFVAAMHPPYPYWTTLLYGSYWTHVLYGVSAACLILPGAFEGKWWSGWYAGRAVRFTGRISYGVYLWHVGIVAICIAWGGRHGLDGWPLTGVAAGGIPLTFGVAWISFRFVEQPLMNGVRLRWRAPRVVSPRPDEA